MTTLIEKSALRNKKLNKIEQLKNLKTVDEAYKKLQYYATAGYDSIEKEDKDFFFKCFGIFDKKATPNQFMLRVRIPGGQLTSLQAKTIGEIAKEYGKDYIDITTRMQVELRYLRIEDLPTVLKKLENSGISTYQTGIDNFRNIVNDPLDGVAYDNIIECQPLLTKIQNLFLNKSEWIGTLPRKFNIGILGSMSNRCNIYGQDCSFVLAQKDGIFGFNVYMGGKVGKIAQDVNVFLKVDEIEKFMISLANVYKKYGFRDNRNRNRFFFFLQEIGIENVVQAIKEEAGYNFSSRGITYVNMEQYDIEFGKIILKNNTFAVHMIVPAGVFTGSDMIECANIADKYGNSQLRLSVEQKLYIIGIQEDKVKELLQEDIFIKYKNIANPYINNVVACAGLECVFGVIANKPDAIKLSEYLAKEVPLSDGKVRLYWSACPKGCGIHGLADIGFEGCKTRYNGEFVDGVHIFLGGKITHKGEEAKQLLRAIPLSNVKYFIKELMLIYKKLKEPNESFEMFESRVLSKYSTGAIGFLMTYNSLCEKFGIDYKVMIDISPKTGKNEVFEIFVFGEQIYKKVTEVKPYQKTTNFRPVGKQKLLPPSKINKEFPKQLDDIIVKMIHPVEDKAYQVFSEVMVDLEAI